MRYCFVMSCNSESFKVWYSHVDSRWGHVSRVFLWHSVQLVFWCVKGQNMFFHVVALLERLWPEQQKSNKKQLRVSVVSVALWGSFCNANLLCGLCWTGHLWMHIPEYVACQRGHYEVTRQSMWHRMPRDVVCHVDFSRPGGNFLVISLLFYTNAVKATCRICNILGGRRGMWLYDQY
jgi:hypothetical protein